MPDLTEPEDSDTSDHPDPEVSSSDALERLVSNEGASSEPDRDDRYTAERRYAVELARIDADVRIETARLDAESRRDAARFELECELTRSRSAGGVAGWPSPTQLEEYQRLLGIDTTRQLIYMLEKEQAHRHEVEQVEVREPFKLARRGQFMAISAVALVLAFCALLAFLGAPQVAAIVAGLDVVSLVVVFVTGQRSSGLSSEILPDNNGPHADIDATNRDPAGELPATEDRIREDNPAGDVGDLVG